MISKIEEKLNLIIMDNAKIALIGGFVVVVALSVALVITI
jgi:hypothetical protein